MTFDLNVLEEKVRQNGKIPNNDVISQYLSDVIHNSLLDSTFGSGSEVININFSDENEKGNYGCATIQ